MDNRQQEQNRLSATGRQVTVDMQAQDAQGPIVTARDVTQNFFNTQGGPLYHGAPADFEVPCPSPPDKPRIFISHYAEGAEERAVLEALESALVSKFEVLADRDRLGHPDTSWSDSMYTWMDLAHSAVVLLSKRSVESTWVLNEASMLGVRKSLRPYEDFVIVPVLLGGFKSSDLQTEQLSGLAAHSPISATTTDDIVQQVNHRLESLPAPPSALTPFENALCKVYEHLYPFGEARIVKLAAALRLDLDQMIPKSDKVSCLAREMWDRKLDFVFEVVNNLVSDYTVPRARLRGFAEIAAAISPAWIDPYSVRKLSGLPYSKSQTGRCIYVRCAHPEFTIKCLLDRATYHSEPVTIVKADGSTDEDVIGILKQQIHDGLCETLEVPKETTTDQDLESLIKSRIPPILAVVPIDFPLDESFVKAFSDDFLPSAIFCFVDKSIRRSSQPQQVPNGITRIWPEPDPVKELISFSRCNELQKRYGSS